jgi:hypothetical protein
LRRIAGLLALAAAPVLVLGVLFVLPVAGMVAEGFVVDGHVAPGAVLDVLARPRVHRVAWFTVWTSGLATLLAVASPGNWGWSSQLALFSLTGTSALNPSAPAEPLSSKLVISGVLESKHPARPAEACVTPRTQLPSPDGQVTSVVFVSDRKLAMLEREPAAISIIDVVSGLASERIELAQGIRLSTGDRHRGRLHLRPGDVGHPAHLLADRHGLVHHEVDANHV